MFYITEKMREEKIVAKIEPAIKKEQSSRQGRGSGRLKVQSALIKQRQNFDF